MGYRKVKIQVDDEQCGQECPFLRFDLGAMIVQCTLFVDVLDANKSRIQLLDTGTQVDIFRCEACKRMEEL